MIKKIEESILTAAVQEEFEALYAGERLDREPPEVRRLGHDYCDGRVDDLFHAFLYGSAFGRALENQLFEMDSAKSKSEPDAEE